MYVRCDESTQVYEGIGLRFSRERAVGRPGWRIGGWGMTKFRLPNDFEDSEAGALLHVLREHASTFIDWGYDDTNFWVELNAEARNPWPYLLREAFERLDAPSEQAQMAMAPLVVRVRAIS